MRLCLAVRVAGGWRRSSLRRSGRRTDGVVWGNGGGLNAKPPIDARSLVLWRTHILKKMTRVSCRVRLWRNDSENRSATGRMAGLCSFWFLGVGGRLPKARCGGQDFFA